MHRNVFFPVTCLRFHSRSRFSVINEKTFPSLERRLADPTTNESADVLLAVLTANSVDRVSYLSDPVMKLRYVASKTGLVSNLRTLGELLIAKEWNLSDDF